MIRKTKMFPPAHATDHNTSYCSPERILLYFVGWSVIAIFDFHTRATQSFVARSGMGPEKWKKKKKLPRRFHVFLHPRGNRNGAVFHERSTRSRSRYLTIQPLFAGGFQYCVLSCVTIIFGFWSTKCIAPCCQYYLPTTAGETVETNFLPPLLPQVRRQTWCCFFYPCT